MKYRTNMTITDSCSLISWTKLTTNSSYWHYWQFNKCIARNDRNWWLYTHCPLLKVLSRLWSLLFWGTTSWKFNGKGLRSLVVICTKKYKDMSNYIWLNKTRCKILLCWQTWGNTFLQLISPIHSMLTRIPSGESIWGSRSKKDRLLKNQWR